VPVSKIKLFQNKMAEMGQEGRRCFEDAAEAGRMQPGGEVTGWQVAAEEVVQVSSQDEKFD
jgi:hypothetical protein